MLLARIGPEAVIGPEQLLFAATAVAISVKFKMAKSLWKAPRIIAILLLVIEWSPTLKIAVRTTVQDVLQVTKAFGASFRVWSFMSVTPILLMHTVGLT